MLYTEKPEIFNPKFEVAGCFVEYKNEILLLLRQDHKNEPNTYWIPGGKVWAWEKIDVAIRREIEEETWIEEVDLKYFKEVYVKYPTYDFIYHMYITKLEQEPEIKINPEEHKSYIWRMPIDALKEDLIEDLDICINMFYKV